MPDDPVSDDESSSTDEPSAVEGRLIDAHTTLLDHKGESPHALYNHTLLCQTSLPYRNPGDDVRVWKRKQGRAFLQVEAGSIVKHPGDSEFTPIGLPYGPTARLILIHLMTYAIVYQTPEVELEGGSLTAYVQWLLGNPGRVNGKNIRRFREQLSRLSVSNIRMAVPLRERQIAVVNTNLISKLELWFPKEPGQRVLWPSTVRFSRDFYDSLVEHAVPLDPAAVQGLQNNARALDVYQWLAQRLWKIRPGAVVRVSWPKLMEQFGGTQKHLGRFKQAMLKGTGKRPIKGVLQRVLYLYPEAAESVLATDEGLELQYARPPIFRSKYHYSKGWLH